MARLANPVVVTGFTELERDLKATGPALFKAMRSGLRQAAEPVRVDAGRLSQTRISGMKRSKKKPPPWSVQKIGQNTKEVYMVPREKGARAKTGASRRRPNFAAIMLSRAYDPALERNRTRILRQVDLTIGAVTREF